MNNSQSKRNMSISVRTQGSYRSLKCLKVLEIHLCFFKALKSLKNSTFSIMVLKSP